MNPFVIFYNLVLQVVSPLLVFIATRWKNNVYLFVACVFTLFVVVDAAYLHIVARMQHAGFDLMLRYRLFAPKPDPEIVIVDIDEASLAAMAKEYGRWPWPRQVLGEFLELLEQQNPKAVVFDILFSDPDIYNPDSDAYFDAAVAETTNTFFPVLRLDEANDSLSEIKPGMIPGVAPLPGIAQDNATIAVVLPYFSSILNSGRLGLHNIYPDPDGVAREYLVYRDDYGWRIPSLPARVIRELGHREPTAASVLLNWRGKPFSFPTASFSDVFRDMISRNKKRPQDEFTDKVVLIGSTAPSLFDIKPTPMSRLHPGVEIMATAIDNMKRGDYLRNPEGRILYPSLALILVWIVGVAFYRDVGRKQIDNVVGTSEFLLLGISYASINFGSTYINLTGPFALGLAHFAVARIYSSATSKALETSVLRKSLEQQGELNAFLLLLRVADAGHRVSEGKLKQICRRLEKTGSEFKSVEMLAGTQKGLWALFENTLVVSWVIPAENGAARTRVTEDIEKVIASYRDMLPRYLGNNARAASWVLHEGRIVGGAGARVGWDKVFAEAQLQWHNAKSMGVET